MQMLTTHPRVFSNKENSPAFPTSSYLSSTSTRHQSTHPTHAHSHSHSHSQHKSRLYPIGIGRAPSSRPKPHSSKPYTRSRSVHRAKVKEALPLLCPSTCSTSSNAKSIPSGSITRSSLPSMQVGKEATSISTRHRPTPIQTSLPVIQERRATRIPLRIPMPIFPPIPSLLIEGIRVPAEYVAARLAPHLFNLLLVSSLYHPYPDVPSPTPPGASNIGTARLHSMAFAIPQVVDKSNVSLASKSQGLEPDICLALSQRGKPDTTVRLIPATNIVYASKCAYWPQLGGVSGRSSQFSSNDDAEINEDETGELDDSESLVDITKVKMEPGFPPLSPTSSSTSSATAIAETHDEVPSSPQSIDSHETATQSPPASPTSSTSSSSSSIFIHLPIVSIDVPSLATFPLLHTHLHTPSRPFAPSLLGLKEADLKTNPTRSMLVAEMDKLPTIELMKKLEVIHGVWQNVCAVGIAAEGTWAAIGEAWGCVVGVLAIRSAGVGRME